MKENELLDLVTRQVEQHQPHSFHLDVVREGVRRDGNWWYIVVRPDRPDVRLSEYNQVLSVVEDEIEKETDESVLLVPALPD